MPKIHFVVLKKYVLSEHEFIAEDIIQKEEKMEFQPVVFCYQITILTIPYPFPVQVSQ